MTDYRIELQAFVDAAASFTEPALGHHKAWAEAVARARIALSVPESSANTVCLITPPPELVQQWLGEYFGCTVSGELSESERYLATASARWGADQELDACCEYLTRCAAWEPEDVQEMLDLRRPKPPSLKAGAIEVLDELDGLFELPAGHYNTILRALEKLDD